MRSKIALIVVLASFLALAAMGTALAGADPLTETAQNAGSTATTATGVCSPRTPNSHAGTSRMPRSVLYAWVNPSVAPVTTRSGVGTQPDVPGTIRQGAIASPIIGCGCASSWS